MVIFFFKEGKKKRSKRKNNDHTQQMVCRTLASHIKWHLPLSKISKVISGFIKESQIDIQKGNLEYILEIWILVCAEATIQTLNVRDTQTGFGKAAPDGLGGGGHWESFPLGHGSAMVHEDSKGEHSCSGWRRHLRKMETAPPFPMPSLPWSLEDPLLCHPSHLYLWEGTAEAIDGSMPQSFFSSLCKAAQRTTVDPRGNPSREAASS